VKLEHAVRVDAPRDRVWSFLMDVPSAARLVPGVGEVREAGDGTYRGTLRVQVGPIRLDLSGDVAVTARDDERGSASLRVLATDARLGGSVRANVDLTLVEREGAAEVRVASDIAILGRIGELGQPVIKRKADQTMAEFAENLRRALAEPP